MTSHTLPPSHLSPDSPQPRPTEVDARAHLSALADGRSDDLAGALQAWRNETAARQTWHAYQLIGDVMRSEDLAQTPAHDLQFLNRLRTQLDQEPAWLVPAAAVTNSAAECLAPSTNPESLANVATRSAPARWHTGAMAAASLAAVAMVVWLARGSFAGGAEDGVPVAAVGSAVMPSAMTSTTEPGPVLRDPRLDEFLRVHQMARGGLPVGVPGGTLQRADLQMTVGTGR